MASSDDDLLSTIKSEIEARIADLRPLLSEYEQLLAAVRALDVQERSVAQSATSRSGRALARERGPRGSAAGVIGRAASRPAVKRTRRPSSDRPMRKTRASRGAAREAILAALEHGSHTVSELVTVTAMSAPNIHGNVRRLLAEGRISKTDRQGKAAYMLAS